MKYFVCSIKLVLYMYYYFISCWGIYKVGLLEWYKFLKKLEFLWLGEIIGEFFYVNLLVGVMDFCLWVVKMYVFLYRFVE